MAPIACRELERDGLTRMVVEAMISYWPISQKTHWHDANFCLGENPTVMLNRFDLCYSFKVLCQVEYGRTRQLHFAAKNYMQNYAYAAREYQPRCITYQRALRNLMVLMFLHYINHLENSGALEVHRTLMAHECLTVASTLGRFHQWQRRACPVDWEKPDWNKIPVPSWSDFCQKYSTALVLLGSAQHPVFAYPKMLGHCFNNVYHQGHFIGDLPAWGKNPTESETKKIYDQEYEEVVAWIENSLRLSHQGTAYLAVPMSLLNPEIVLPTRTFWE